MTNSNLSAARTPLLDDTVDAFLDYKSRRVRRSNSGGWRSSSFIIAVEIAERFAYYGISSNLIIYLTGPLGESTASAAAQLNAWSGAVSLLPLFGAFIADSFLGRYYTIILSSLIYILGLGLLTLSATLTSVGNSGDQNSDNVTLSSLRFQVILFFFSLYLVAFGQGGFKPCVQAFGADQFDRQDPEECKAQRSFFNWWYFGICAGAFVTLWILPYIQDNLSWVLGFGIPTIVMVVVLVVFMLGTATYRFCIKGKEESPFVRIGRVFILAVRNWKMESSAIAAYEESQGPIPTESLEQFKFLNKALLAPDGSNERGKACSISEVEEAKTVIRLVPIWAASLFYAVAYAQTSTFFTKQGATMDRSVTTGFQIPAASLQSFISLAITLFIPIYDRIFVPLARSLTGKPGGITMLQRIGPGMLIAITSMLTAALVEMRRLKMLKNTGC
ncbi:Protein NRT1/ PTR FAMILY 5.14 [Hibiscus syriacus]|uniref:Protein NRT1/ PTR FAMILY 5.14 n=1 Tax=Hibiscus syriacus TaxID=106335 RepID=A0A6A2Y9N6_HIBSY|nr:Protein NRT1/ PTR FAMILY 5.14 [Hibiscus syriacus]